MWFCVSVTSWASEILRPASAVAPGFGAGVVVPSGFVVSGAFMPAPNWKPAWAATSRLIFCVVMCLLPSRSSMFCLRRLSSAFGPLPNQLAISVEPPTIGLRLESLFSRLSFLYSWRSLRNWSASSWLSKTQVSPVVTVSPAAISTLSLPTSPILIRPLGFSVPLTDPASVKVSETCSSLSSILPSLLTSVLALEVVSSNPNSPPNSTPSVSNETPNFPPWVPDLVTVAQVRGSNSALGSPPASSPLPPAHPPPPMTEETAHENLSLIRPPRPVTSRAPTMATATMTMPTYSRAVPPRSPHAPHEDMIPRHLVRDMFASSPMT